MAEVNEEATHLGCEVAHSASENDGNNNGGNGELAYVLNDTPIASDIPSTRKRTSKSSCAHARTSSSGNKWGSKCQVSSDLIRRLRVSGEICGGGLNGVFSILSIVREM